MKKVLKILAVIAAIAGACAAVYVIVNKVMAKKQSIPSNDYENYVSCSCCDDDFVSETVAYYQLKIQADGLCRPLFRRAAIVPPHGLCAATFKTF